jgi:hypothetical protein
MKTKIVLLTLTAIVLIQLNARAQKFNYGIVAGVNMVQLAPIGNDHPHLFDRPRASFNINAHIGYKYNKNWGLTVEPGFMTKGGSIQNDDSKLKLNYLQIPILADYYLNDRISISFGPELAYLLSAQIKIDGNAIDAQKVYDQKFELSGVIGLNFELESNIDMGVRYSHGLMHISEMTYFDMNGFQLSNAKEYNQYLQCFVRFKI